MAATVEEAQIEQVYELLRAYGPATAYDYMQQTGGLQKFPSSLLMQVNIELRAEQQGASSPFASTDTSPSGDELRRATLS